MEKTAPGARAGLAAPAAPSLLVGMVLMALLMAGALTGCGPKRVLRTAPPNPAEPESGIHEPQQTQRGLQAAGLARQQIGKNYRWGANGPEEFDCSGLVQFVYGALGVDLPRESRLQAAVGRSVARGELQPGDLVFFSLRSAGIDHVGIFTGEEEFVHAPRIHLPVTADSLNDPTWKSGFVEARRLP